MTSRTALVNTNPLTSAFAFNSTSSSSTGVDPTTVLYRYSSSLYFRALIEQVVWADQMPSSSNPIEQSN
ncbi:unnamed protein product [Phytophthora fragariaefolia]|uniref:Unnamed protein product n=1 Tax=Phytophthora fragariaefolia TaxID=1490495 RepID=A0A9W7CIU6_9STRA|nr:unnamed protein product [Phytophthora fragariaefolia]